MEGGVSGWGWGSDGDHPTSLKETTEGGKGDKGKRRGVEGNDWGMLLDTLRGSGRLWGTRESLGLETEGGTQIEKIKILLGGIGNC